MCLVRFKFYGDSHAKPHTGYLAIVLKDYGEKWSMSSNSLRQRELTTLEGCGKLNGGKVFLEEMHHFIAYWATAQADAVENHRMWSAAKQPQQKLVRPGFRAVTAAKQWHAYVESTKKESALIEADVQMAYAALYTQGWIATPETTPFPMFIYGDPWKIRSRYTQTHDQPGLSTKI